MQDIQKWYLYMQFKNKEVDKFVAFTEPPKGISETQYSYSDVLMDLPITDSDQLYDINDIIQYMNNGLDELKNILKN